MAPPKPQKPDELPKAVDFDQIMNKTHLSFSQRNAKLNCLSKPRASSAAKPKPEDNGAEKPKLSFSSLANRPSPHPSLRKSQQQRKTFSQPRSRERDDDEEAPENSGIGHVPAGQEAEGDSRAAETRDLKGKLLGKRALEQKEEARKKRARAKEDSSDEEEGRSAAVGKGRKKKGRKGGAD